MPARIEIPPGTPPPYHIEMSTKEMPLEHCNCTWVIKGKDWRNTRRVLKFMNATCVVHGHLMIEAYLKGNARRFQRETVKVPKKRGRPPKNDQRNA